MKYNRAQFYVALFACFALCVALAASLSGYFRSVELSESTGTTEKHLLSQLKIFHDSLKSAESPDEAKSALKLLEGISGLGPESDGSREMKKAYSPVLAVFASKPREAEARFQLGRKRELMESLVNAYRKEIPHGDIRVRAAYLNVLFDTQASLLSESEEAEQVFIKRNRDRIDGLKSLVASAGDPGLPGRVANIDSVFQSYERAFAQGSKWRAQKQEALLKQEKALPSVAKSVFAGQDSGAGEGRLTFLYICSFCLLSGLLSFFCLFIGFKFFGLRAELKVDAFVTYLRSFGSERRDPDVERAVELLRKDTQWGPLVAESQRAEEAFLNSCHNQLAVPRSVRLPFFVMSKDKTLLHWNEPAAEIFALTKAKEWSLADLLHDGLLRAREGNSAALFELLNHTILSAGEDAYELILKREAEWQPYELIVSPITSGPLAGGKVFLWRAIRSEVERVERSVTAQLERIRELVHKVTHQYSVDLTPVESDAAAVRAMISDLETMKRKADERELLWKSEAQALVDQVTRQQDILYRLSIEFGEIRAGHSEAISLVRHAHEDEENWHDEVCAMERDLERWSINRERLLGDLEQQSATLEKAKKFEAQLRSATEAVKSELETYEDELATLSQFSDSARMHSVNLSLVRDPAYWEYASRARSFSHELARFIDLARTLGAKVRRFIAEHPGGALAAHLHSPGLDIQVLDTIRQEQERTAVLLRRWKESGESILSGGEKALALLNDADKKGAIVSQLGETSLLINQQTKGNLERWN